jgi:hypothetical protein
LNEEILHQRSEEITPQIVLGVWNSLEAVSRKTLYPVYQASCKLKLLRIGLRSKPEGPNLQPYVQPLLGSLRYLTVFTNHEYSRNVFVPYSREPIVCHSFSRSRHFKTHWYLGSPSPSPFRNVLTPITS